MNHLCALHRYHNVLDHYNDKNPNPPSVRRESKTPAKAAMKHRSPDVAVAPCMGENRRSVRAPMSRRQCLQTMAAFKISSAQNGQRLVGASELPLVMGLLKDAACAAGACAATCSDGKALSEAGD